MPEEQPLAKYPDIPWSEITTWSFLSLRAQDLSSRSQIEELIWQMFDEPETQYFLYLAEGEIAPEAARHAEGRNEIYMRQVKRPFYLHRAGGDRTFTQIREAARGSVEYLQVTLRLTEKMTRGLTIQRQLAAAKAAEGSVVVPKLTIWGFGLDLGEIWKRIRRRKSK